MNNYKDELWDILEDYSETPLFRDWNDPKVNDVLRRFEADLLDLHSRFTPPLYRIEKP